MTYATLDTGYVLEETLTWNEVVIVNPCGQDGLDVLLLWVCGNTCCHKQTGRQSVSLYDKHLVQASRHVSTRSYQTLPKSNKKIMHSTSAGLVTDESQVSHYFRQRSNSL